MRIFVGASSNENLEEKYVNDCKKLLEVLLKENDLVFGAYNNGLMGISYEIAKKYNRKVTGMCPEFYRDRLEALDCDKSEVTSTMLDSTLKIYENSDLLIFLPGGFGSIYEFFTANYSKICDEINIPIILYNSCGFYDKLIEFIDEIDSKKLIRDSEKNKFVIANNIEEVMLYLKEYM